MTNANAPQRAGLPLVGALRACRVAWVAIALAAPAAAAQHPLVSIPLEDPVYPVLAAIDAAGCRHARVSPYRPWLVRDVRRALEAARRDSRCSDPSVIEALDGLQARFTRDTFDLFSETGGGVFPGASLLVRSTSNSNGVLRPLWRGIQASGVEEPGVAAIARGRVTWSTPRLAAVAEAVAYTSRRNDPTIRQRALRNTGGAVDFGDSYVNVLVAQPLVLSFGRAEEAWLGAARESVILSAHGPSLDRIAVSGRWRRVEGRAILAALSAVQLSPELDSIPGQEARRFFRYLVGHALTIRPSRALELTVGETALLARGTRTIELAYANPLMPFVITQNDTSRTGADQDDNLQLFAALVARSGGSRLQVDALVDDIQLDAADRERIQDQLAWSVRGSQVLSFLPLGSATVEYRHVNSFTYLRPSYATGYTNYDQPLGSELGPDADLVLGSVEVWPRPRLRVSAGAGVWRQGAQRLDQRPARGANDTRALPYPSTTVTRPGVQRAVLAEGETAYYLPKLQVVARAELASVRNSGNRLEPRASFLRLQMIGRYAIRIP